MPAPPAHVRDGAREQQPRRRAWIGQDRIDPPQGWRRPVGAPLAERDVLHHQGQDML
ncbi:MAG: hypothetical protein M3Q65_14315 [Chloroflexota bacterium]|nr:hypothetical protein [Chloroflexota bacterium]